MSENGRVTLSTGVVLAVVDVSIAALGAIKAQMYAQRPVEPTMWLEEKGRDELNPNDPDYIAAIEDWEERQSTRLLEATIMLGTEIHSVPEGFPQPAEGKWTRPFALVGIEIPAKGQRRYLAWVKYRAAPTAKDIETLLLATSRHAGVTEEDAAEAAQSFRSDAKQ